MKGIILGSLLLISAAPALAAATSCETVRNDIAQKIIANGVPENGFTLTIVANDQADSAGQVVGHCANDTQKIVYQRQSGDADAAGNQ